MNARRRRLGKTGALLLLLLLLLLAARARAGDDALPLAVRDGRGSCVLATPDAGDKFLVVVGSLSRKPGPFHVSVRAEPCDGPEAVPLEVTTPGPDWARRNDELRQRLARARRAAAPPDEFPPSADPPRRRTFHLFAGTNDFQSPQSYVAVTGELRAVGRHCQVYADRDGPDADALRAAIADAVRTFDEEVYPRARECLGRVVDVDRDGRFTLLFTPRLAKLCDGKVALGGFVRGSDFYRDLAAPFGNRCDMMYLNADLKPGPHLRTLIAHEYVHAVLFSEHVFGDYLPGRQGQDEESWLNEGLAHLNEARHGYSWSNLDYRLSAFLSAPERYPLVVPDYYAAGVWRSPGYRGAAYFFLRWCEERFGPDLAARLVRSNLAGTENLEAATGVPFAELFRQWTVALATGDAGRVEKSTAPFGRLLCGPHFAELPLAGGTCELAVAGTAAAYLLLHSPGGSHARLSLRAEPDAALQVSVIRLPARQARLGLTAEVQGTTLRLTVTAHDADVTLADAAWEGLTPAAGRAEETSYRADAPPGETVRAWFGDERVKAGEPRTSAAVALPAAGGPFVVKLLGRDATGTPVAAWAVVPAKRE